MPWGIKYNPYEPNYGPSPEEDKPFKFNYDSERLNNSGDTDFGFRYTDPYYNPENIVNPRDQYYDPWYQNPTPNIVNPPEDRDIDKGPGYAAGEGGGGGGGSSPPKDERTQFEKDAEEFRKILETILGAVPLPEFAKTFGEAFGKLPALNLPSFEEATSKILQGADYRGLQEEALGTIDQNLEALNAIASMRGLGRSGLQAAKGRDITSRVLQGLARDINADKLQRAALLGNIQQNMLGLQARDLESRRGSAQDVWKSLLGAALAQQGISADVWSKLLQGKSAQAQQQSANQTGWLGSFLSFIGTILGGILSDENAKDVHGYGKDTADKFMDSLAPYVYNYKGDTRKHLGVMAQDVEKVLPDAIIETPLGKAIDVKSATGAVLASLARLNERVKDLERRA